jgi:RNA polymerase sigma-70 factor, ECF subfamily
VNGLQASSAELGVGVARPDPLRSIGGPSSGGDGELLRRLRAGEERAFEELFRDHGPKLLAVARHFLPSEDEARDAVQEAFLSAFRGLPRFRGDSSLSTWLHRIVIHAALMKLRLRTRHPEVRIEDLLPRFDAAGQHSAPVEPWDASSASPEAIAANGELRLTIRACVDRLPVPYRTVLILRDIQELSTSEAAALLGLTGNAVKIRLHRARLALRELLAPHLAARPTDEKGPDRRGAIPAGLR